MKEKSAAKVDLVFLILTISFLLSFPSKGLCKKIELSLNILNSQNQEAGIELETSSPAYYHWFYVKNPPALVVDFFEDELFCSFDKKIVLEKGSIEKVETFYLNKEGAVDFLVFKFRNAPLVTAVPDTRSLTIKINNILLSKKGKTLEKQAQIESALSLAREKIKQKKSQEYSVLDSPRDIEIERDVETGLNAALEGGVEASLAEVVPKQERSVDLSKVQKPLLQAEQRVLTPPGEIKKIDFHLPISNAEILNSFMLGGQVGAALKGINAKSISSPKLLNDLSLVTSFKPSGLITTFIYLFGSIYMVGMMAFWYKVKNKREADDKILIKTIKQEQTVSKITESEKKKKSISERRRFPRLEIEELVTRQRPGLRIETTNEPKPRYACRLKNLSLGGACFEVPPRVHVPLMAQMEIILPDRLPIEVCARIVWQRIVQTKTRVYGACFMTIDQENRTNLDSYLTKNLENNER